MACKVLRHDAPVGLCSPQAGYALAGANGPRTERTSVAGWDTFNKIARSARLSLVTDQYRGR